MTLKSVMMLIVAIILLTLPVMTVVALLALFSEIARALIH